MSIFSRSVLLLLFGLLLLTVSIAVLNTLVPLWLFHQHFPVWNAGMVACAYFIGNLVGALSAGRLIHLYGFNQSYYCACILFLLAAIGLLLPINLFSWVICRFFAGIAAALVWVIVESALLRAGNVAQRGLLLAAYMMTYYLGTVLGQLLITVLPNTRLFILLGSAILAVLSILPLYFAHFLRPVTQERSNLLLVLKLPQTRLGMYGCIISGVVLGSLYGLLPIYLAHQGNSNIAVGYWMALMIGSGVLGQWPAGWLAGKYGRLSVLRIQVMMIIVGCVILLSQQSLGIALFLLGSAVLTLYPVAMALACEKVSGDKIVTMNQSLLLSYTIGSLIGPLLISVFMQYYSDKMLFMLIGLSAVLYLGLLLRQFESRLDPITL